MYSSEKRIINQGFNLELCEFTYTFEMNYLILQYL